MFIIPPVRYWLIYDSKARQITVRRARFRPRHVLAGPTDDELEIYAQLRQWRATVIEWNRRLRRLLG